MFARKEHFNVSSKEGKKYKQKIKAFQCIPVFCRCCLPAMSGIDLIECSSCKVWHHIQICVNVDKKYLAKKKQWFCYSVTQFKNYSLLTII